jgi:DNA/RNA non-specific endonuclease
MKSSVRVVTSAWIFALMLSGCAGGNDEPVAAPQAAATAPQADDAVTRLESAYGGPDGLKEFFDTHSQEEISAVLAGYGMQYRVNPSQIAQAGSEEEQAAKILQITDCEKYFPPEDRNVWQNFDGEFYFIDSSGRPNRAYKDLPPISSAPRITSCQSKIGRWGDAENPSNDYDGGHLIGAQLGGWGGRANIVPQDSNFNQGRWVQLESKMASCRVLPNARLRYTITVSYANTSNLVPSRFEMSIRNRSTNSSVTMQFQNVDGGGSNGASESARGMSFLTANGC